MFKRAYHFTQWCPSPLSVPSTLVVEQPFSGHMDQPWGSNYLTSKFSWFESTWFSFLWAGIQKFIFAIEVQVHENLINHILTAVTDKLANLHNWFILENQFDVPVKHVYKWQYKFTCRENFLIHYSLSCCFHKPVHTNYLLLVCPLPIHHSSSIQMWTPNTVITTAVTNLNYTGAEESHCSHTFIF
jgi:hypothetical protein